MNSYSIYETPSMKLNKQVTQGHAYSYVCSKLDIYDCSCHTVTFDNKECWIKIESLLT